MKLVIRATERSGLETPEGPELSRTFKEIKMRQTNVAEDMRMYLREQINCILREICDHMDSRGTLEKLRDWPEQECPSVGNPERLTSVAMDLVMGRIRNEVTMFEKRNQKLKKLNDSLREQFFARLDIVPDHVIQVRKKVTRVLDKQGDMESAIRASVGERNIPSTSTNQQKAGNIPVVAKPKIAKAIKGGGRTHIQQYRTNKSKFMINIVNQIVKQLHENNYRTLREILAMPIAEIENHLEDMCRVMRLLMTKSARCRDSFSSDTDSESDQLQYMIDLYLPSSYECEELIGQLHLYYVETICHLDVDYDNILDLDLANPLASGGYANVYNVTIRTYLDGSFTEKPAAAKFITAPLSERNVTTILSEHENLR